MRILLACLICFVLTTAQCFALKGGPVFGSGTATTTGIYAGVLYPSTGVNSIGLFSVTIPKTGLGSGSVFLFANQNAYTGTMNATADPDSARFTGFVDAGFNFIDSICTANCTDPDTTKRTITTTTVRAVASGRIDGKVRASAANARTTARLVGAPPTNGALLQFNPDFFGVGAITYQLVGFKQADI